MATSLRSAHWIPEGFIADLLRQVDLVSLISEYTVLKPVGHNFMGLCPFPDHREKTPSFSVSPAKQLYHCFGCKRGGNALTFVRDFYQWDFVSAVQFLAQKVGMEVPVPEADRSHWDQKKRALSLLEKVCQFYQEQLESHRSSVDVFLQKRGISPFVAQLFRLGYSPSSGYALTRFLKKDEWPLAAQLGLIRKNAWGQHYDFFRDRLMFPIIHHQLGVVAFGGRVVSDSPQTAAKYLNSPESEWFKKGEILFGLKAAGPFIRKNGWVVVVEGYMDVLTLMSQGIESVVAPLGTAMTPAQVALLKNWIDQIILLFDGDEAGLKALGSLLPLFWQQGLLPRAAVLPQGLDPDDFVRQRGIQALKSLIESSEDALTVWLRHQSLGQLWERKKVARQVLGWLQTVSDPLIPEFYVPILSQQLGVSPEALWKGLRGAESGGTRPKPSASTPRLSFRVLDLQKGPEPEGWDLERLSQAVVALALQEPESWKKLWDVRDWLDPKWSDRLQNWNCQLDNQETSFPMLQQLVYSLMDPAVMAQVLAVESDGHPTAVWEKWLKKLQAWRIQQALNQTFPTEAELSRWQVLLRFFRRLQKPEEPPLWESATQVLGAPVQKDSHT